MRWLCRNKGNKVVFLYSITMLWCLLEHPSRWWPQQKSLLKSKHIPSLPLAPFHICILLLYPFIFQVAFHYYWDPQPHQHTNSSFFLLFIWPNHLNVFLFNHSTSCTSYHTASFMYICIAHHLPILLVNISHLNISSPQHILLTAVPYFTFMSLIHTSMVTSVLRCYFRGHILTFYNPSMGFLQGIPWHSCPILFTALSLLLLLPSLHTYKHNTVPKIPKQFHFLRALSS